MALPRLSLSGRELETVESRRHSFEVRPQSSFSLRSRFLVSRRLAALALPVTLVVMTAALTRAQPKSKLSFEVASVKRNASADNRLTLGPRPGGRFTATNVTLKMLLGIAYNVRDENISGGPDWISTIRWNIEAKAEANSIPAGVGPWPDSANPDHPLTQMLQSLIEDRFLLKMHRETKEIPIYELLVAKTGSKMKLSADQESSDIPAPAKGASSPPRGMMRMGRDSLEGNGIPIARLAQILSERSVLGRPVIDHTDLKGLYDFKLQWTPDSAQGAVSLSATEPPQPPADISGPSIFTAMQEQLGLKLQPAKGPAEVLIIDSIQMPTEN